MGVVMARGTVPATAMGTKIATEVAPQVMVVTVMGDMTVDHMVGLGATAAITAMAAPSSRAC